MNSAVPPAQEHAAVCTRRGQIGLINHSRWHHISDTTRQAQCIAQLTSIVSNAIVLSWHSVRRSDCFAQNKFCMFVCLGYQHVSQQKQIFFCRNWFQVIYFSTRLLFWGKRDFLIRYLSFGICLPLVFWGQSLPRVEACLPMSRHQPLKQSCCPHKKNQPNPRLSGSAQLKVTVVVNSRLQANGTTEG